MWSMFFWALTSCMLVVRAEYAPVYLFPDSNATACTDTEWNEVLQTMGNASTVKEDEEGGAQ
jgi:hypothetical protein